MKRFLLIGSLMICCLSGFSQHPHGSHVNWQEVYRATPEKINNLVHTKLDARLDFPKSQLHGKVWITLRPHFYATDSLQLDAKGMDIREVSVIKNGKKQPLKYRYDKMVLDIDLDKSYKRNESYTIYIDYTAKPNEYTGRGSAAITDAKGLYFIDPLGEIDDKPTQVWTQGETEATSVWVPTIDRPNQKTTQEILLTVPAKYVTLSNGKMISQKKNADGTRTDHWKMDQPHAPYLFFLGAGDFAVVKDQYKGKEVSYFVDKEYASVARKIYGMTPAMMSFFSSITGIDYPWVKYSQMTAHDYVSGAMENTTATLHSAVSQQDARELTDGNRWEEVIAHELFHHWFGDYVTTESWSNLTINESFASLGSQLWNEYRYGKDAAYEERYNSSNGYLNSRSENKDLVRFHYRDKEDMFDAVSYNKGAAILQMLRNFVGEEAFNKSMNLFLTSNKYKAAEAHQVRLAFEEVTGKDLNWFFNQWFFGSGHPELNITYSYNDQLKQVQVIVEQQQQQEKVFVLPVKIDVWHGSMPTRYDVWVKQKVDTFVFASMSKPDFVNFDADKIILGKKKENKTLDEYIAQYRKAWNYIDRREAIDAALASQEAQKAVAFLSEALRDPYGPLREYTIQNLDMSLEQVKTYMRSFLLEAAQKDKHRLARAAAISKLGNYRDASYASIFKSAINDSSYSVAGNALEALSKVDTASAYREASRLAAMPHKGRLKTVIQTLMSTKDPSAADEMIRKFVELPFGQEKFQALQGLFEFMVASQNDEQFKKSVDAIMDLQKQVPEAYREQINPALNAALREIQKEKMANGLQAQADYIDSRIPKGF